MKNVLKFVILTICLFNNLKGQTLITNTFDNNITLNGGGASTIFNYQYSPSVLRIDNHQPAPGLNTGANINGGNYSHYVCFTKVVNNPTGFDSLDVKFTVHNAKYNASFTFICDYFFEVIVNGTSIRYGAPNTATTDTVHTFNFRIKSNKTTDTIKINYVPTTCPAANPPQSIVKITNLVISGITTVGINEYTKNAARLNVFPNPTVGDINIKFNASKIKSPIEIFDIQGRLVQENTEEREVGENNIKLNLESLSAGIYIVRVETSTFKITLVK